MTLFYPHKKIIVNVILLLLLVLRVMKTSEACVLRICTEIQVKHFSLFENNCVSRTSLQKITRFYWPILTESKSSDFAVLCLFDIS